MPRHGDLTLFRRVTRAPRSDHEEIGRVHVTGYDPFTTLCGHLDRFDMAFEYDAGPATCTACMTVARNAQAILDRLAAFEGKRRCTEEEP